MGDFFRIGSEMTEGFATGFAAFWDWFVNPLFTIDLTWLNADLEVITIAPWMILSFSAIMLIFAISLYHLLNPIG